LYKKQKLDFMNSIYMDLVGNTMGREGYLDPVLPLKVKGKNVKNMGTVTLNRLKTHYIRHKEKYPYQRL